MAGASTDLDSVRVGLRSSTDRRATATRSRLYDAVRTLAVTDADITVKSIADAAGVSRATFYTHFSGLDDLALRLQEVTFHEIARDAALDGSAEQTMLLSQRRLLAHYALYRPLYARVFLLAVPRGVQSPVAAMMTTEILSHIRSIAPAPVGVDDAIAASYIAHAATGVIVDWVLGEIDATEDELALQLVRLMPSWMHTPSPPPPEASAESSSKE